MRKSQNMHAARSARNDEFYTQYGDVEHEVVAYPRDTFRDKVVLLPADDPSTSNFTRYFLDNLHELGIKRLISTSYGGAHGKGRVYVHDASGESSNEWLEGDGDFRSTEVTALLRSADVVVTNPPFSLFREFLAWVVNADKEFLIIGNKNSLTCREVWPLVQSGRVWPGTRPWAGGMWFILPEDAEKVDRYDGDVKMGNVPSIWFTNLDHAKRHVPLVLMSMEDNLRSGRTSSAAYERYDNYDAIEVPRTAMIPSDYDGVMGVPISFLDKYSPEQFEILGMTEGRSDSSAAHLRLPGHQKYERPYLGGACLYARILIRHRRLLD